MENWNKVNRLTEILKKGHKIHIKSSHKGLFTKYCNGKVTSECIARGKSSPNPAIRKRATFAANARKWKHAFGGSIEGEETEKYEPTLEDIIKFASSFEAFKDTPYQIPNYKGEMQTLAGFGSANQKIIDLASQGKLTREIALNEVRNNFNKIYNRLSAEVPGFNNLPMGARLGITDIVYNGSGVDSFKKKNPNLIQAINLYDASNPDSLQAVVSRMNHSKNAGGWLGVRSSARRAMALGKYDWNWPTLDKYGRQVDHTQYKGPQDWKSSPYYQKYARGGNLIYKPLLGSEEQESYLQDAQDLIYDNYKPPFPVVPVEMPNVNTDIEKNVAETPEENTKSIEDINIKNFSLNNKDFNVLNTDGTNEEKRRAATKYLMQNLDLTKVQASALIGNWDVESKFVLNAENSYEKAGKSKYVKPSQYGIGIGQWTHGRHDNYVNYINSHGKSTSLQNQLDFAIDEIKTKYQDYLNNLRTADNIKDATAYTYVQYVGGNNTNIKDKEDLYRRVNKMVEKYKTTHLEQHGKASNGFEIRLKAAEKNLSI